MTFDNKRAQELLGKLRRRGECFDLMVQFFDRAHQENDTDRMAGAYNAMVTIHSGDQHGR